MAKKNKKKQKPDEDNSQTTLADLKKFIAAIEKKYGSKTALAMPVEVHRPFVIDGEKGTFWAPHELTTLSVAKYDHEAFHTVIVR